MWGTIQLLIFCGTAIVLGLMTLLSLPQSQLRATLLPILQWAFVIFCGIYCLSPVDLVPEALLGPLGLADDALMAIAGVASAIAARKAVPKR